MQSATISIANANTSAPELQLVGLIRKDTYVLITNQLNELARLGKTEYSLIVNSEGGSVTDGNAIISAISSHKVKLKSIEVRGYAASMAAAVVVAFKPLAVMRKSALLMLHKASGGDYGSAKRLRESADLIEQAEQTIVDQMVEATGIAEDDFRKRYMIEGQDVWLTAQQALDQGLISAVLDSKAETKNLAPLSAEERQAEAITMMAADSPNPKPIADDGQHEPSGTHKPQSPMKELEMLAQVLDLNPAASPENITAQVKNLVEMNATLKDEKASLEAKVKTFELAAEKAKADEVKAVVEKAIREGRILASAREKYEALGASDLESVKAILAEQPVSESLLGQLQAQDTTGAPDRKTVGVPENLKGKGYDLLFNEHHEELKALAKSHPETAKALYMAEFKDSTEAEAADQVKALNA